MPNLKVLKCINKHLGNDGGRCIGSEPTLRLPEAMYDRIVSPAHKWDQPAFMADSMVQTMGW